LEEEGSPSMRESELTAQLSAAETGKLTDATQVRCVVPTLTLAGQESVGGSLSTTVMSKLQAANRFAVSRTAYELRVVPTEN